MVSKWNESKSKEKSQQFEMDFGRAFGEMLYVTQLIGNEPDLALHGGGNTSFKSNVTTVVGETVEAIYVKASGVDMKTIDDSGFVCLDHGRLKKLSILESIDDAAMANEFKSSMLASSDKLPSIETLMHVFIDRPCIVHTHPTALLALTNRKNGAEAVADACGKNNVCFIEYASSGLSLAKSVFTALMNNANAKGILISHHGLVTWGNTAKEAYEKTIDIVDKAQQYLNAKMNMTISVSSDTDIEIARARYAAIAPMLRGLVSPKTNDQDNPYSPMILVPLISKEILGLLSHEKAKEIACSSAITPDYLVRAKSVPLFVENPDYGNIVALKETLDAALSGYSSSYESYMKKYASQIPSFHAEGLDLLPRVVLLPGMGAVCIGHDFEKACIVRDIVLQAMQTKIAIYQTNGGYAGLSEDHIFDMEFRAFQVAKVTNKESLPLRGKVAIVTGAAGAIGSGICDELLASGCHVAVTDLAGDNLNSMTRTLSGIYGNRVIGVPLDVTNKASVSSAFETVVNRFGGVDIVVVNAGLAHVAPLVDLDMEAFQRLERVNVEGTLLMLAEAGRCFRLQNMGGDIVLVSTKNVFAPGAKFGAYSATKAASHQLARIASLEFADMNVRVNMVSPDAVFSHGETKSGLWAKVGPDRMKARGLSEKGLEEYYQSRNLLKARVTARHVAKAVLFFVTHQTPTTGATIPVDGGLPDATPR